MNSYKDLIEKFPNNQKAETKIIDNKSLALLLVGFAKRSPFSTAICDFEGNVIFCNNFFNKLFNIKLDNTINVFENVRKTKKNIRSIEKLKNGKTLISINKYDSKNLFSEMPKKVLQLRTTTMPIYNNDKISFFVQIHENLSKAKKLSNKLIDEELKYKMIFDNVPHGIAMIDKSGNIIQSNMLFDEILSTQKNKINSINDVDIDYKKSLENLINQSFIENIKVDDIIFIKNKYFEIKKAISVKCVPLKLKNSRKFLANIIVEDITKDILKDLALKEVRERYQYIFENTNDLFFTVDFEGNLTTVNPIAKSILGIDFDSMKDKHIKNFMTYDSYLRAMDAMQSKLKGNKDQTVYEITTFNKNGEKVILEVNSFLRMKNRVPYEIFGIGRDITLRKQHEEQISASLREKEYLIKEIHHRIKNNLQITISLIRMNNFKSSDANIKQFLNDLQLKIQAISLVHENIYLSGNSNIVKLEEYFKKIISNSYNIYKTTKNLEINTNIKECKMNMDIVIPCGLMINEIFNNAIKFAYTNCDNPKFNIYFACVEGKATLKIEYNGLGFNIKELKLNSNKTVGINLVKILAEEQLHGNIKISSQKGQNRFEITFPCCG